MKKFVMCVLFAVLSFAVRANTQTNYVYVISNVFVHTYHDSVVTQKVKNTHYNYYFTNNYYNVTYDIQVITQRVIGTHYNYYHTNYLQDVVYETRYIVQTNMAYTQMFDVSQNAINQAQGYANAASASADSASASASSAASSASRAASSASSASYSASSASSSASAARTAAANGLATINQRIQWFDDHSGETITKITTNIYYAVDSTARSSASDAQSTASAAQSTASAAQSTASAAQSTANDAQSTASAAQSTANAAQSSANAAMQKVDKITNVIDNLSIDVTEYRSMTEKSESKSIIHTVSGGWCTTVKVYVNNVESHSGYAGSDTAVRLNEGEEYNHDGEYVRCISGSILVYPIGNTKGAYYISTYRQNYGATVKFGNRYTSNTETLSLYCLYGVYEQTKFLLERQKTSERPSSDNLTFSYTYGSGDVVRCSMQTISDVILTDYYLSSDLNIRDGSSNSVMDRLATTNDVMKMVRKFMQDMKNN